MPQQLVEVAVINRALGLHEHTPLASTIAQIAHLVSFRQQHESSANLIFTLRDELAKIKATLLQQNNQYLKKRIEMARQQSTKLFKIQSIPQPGLQIGKKEYLQFESLQQFMRREYDIKLKRNQQKNAGMKLGQSVSQYYLPVEHSLQRESGKQDQQRAKDPRGGIVLGDFV